MTVPLGWGWMCQLLWVLARWHRLLSGPRLSALVGPVGQAMAWSRSQVRLGVAQPGPVQRGSRSRRSSASSRLGSCRGEVWSCRRLGVHAICAMTTARAAACSWAASCS